PGCWRAIKLLPHRGLCGPLSGQLENIEMRGGKSVETAYDEHSPDWFAGGGRF
ncbi:MAG: hypothetical protein JWL81_1940, partial [Verrucomicrobiales bacterium]|nr:hypothetical protein [Verrucomicrobiales bacterium]